MKLTINFAGEDARRNLIVKSLTLGEGVKLTWTMGQVSRGRFEAEGVRINGMPMSRINLPGLRKMPVTGIEVVDTDADRTYNWAEIASVQLDGLEMPERNLARFQFMDVREEGIYTTMTEEEYQNLKKVTGRNLLSGLLASVQQALA